MERSSGGPRSLCSERKSAALPVKDLVKRRPESQCFAFLSLHTGLPCSLTLSEQVGEGSSSVIISAVGGWSKVCATVLSHGHWVLLVEVRVGQVRSCLRRDRVFVDIVLEVLLEVVPSAVGASGVEPGEVACQVTVDVCCDVQCS